MSPLTAVTWPRTFPPMRTTWPEGKSPLISASHSSRKQVRDSIQVGVRWTETFPPVFARSQEAYELMTQARRWHREGRPVLVRPFFHRRTREQLAGGPAAGAAGVVDVAFGFGADNTTLRVTGFSADGLIRAGDYLAVENFPYVLWLTADATVSAGVVVVSFEPPVFAGTLPQQNSTATLNGLFECYIAVPPQMPATISPGPEHFGGFDISFEEAVPSRQETSLDPA